MSQEGRGCLVADQDGSDKVTQFKIEGRGPGPQFPHWIRTCNCSQRVWKANGTTNKTLGIQVFVHEVTMQSINSRRMIGDCYFK